MFGPRHTYMRLAITMMMASHSLIWLRNKLHHLTGSWIALVLKTSSNALVTNALLSMSLFVISFSILCILHSRVLWKDLGIYKTNHESCLICNALRSRGPGVHSPWIILASILIRFHINDMLCLPITGYPYKLEVDLLRSWRLIPLWTTDMDKWCPQKWLVRSLGLNNTYRLMQSLGDRPRIYFGTFRISL